MKQSFRGFAFFIALTLTSPVSSADVLWDTVGRQDWLDHRDAGGQQTAGHWTNTNSEAIHLTSVGFLGRVAPADAEPASQVGTNIDFWLIDSAGPGLEKAVVFADNLDDQLITAQVDWTIAAGSSFFIATIPQSAGLDSWYRFPPPFTTQTKLRGENNGNFGDLGNGALIHFGDGGVEMTWQLQGNVLPDPACIGPIWALSVLVQRRSSRKQLGVTSQISAR